MKAFSFLHTLVTPPALLPSFDRVSRGTPVLGGAVPKWRIMKSVMCSLIIVVSLCAFAQVSPVPDVSGLVSDRKAPAFPVTVVQPAPFEFRGIRIGDGMKEAERKFLALKVPSLSSKPGLCGSDGISRIETCTDVLDTGEYVNMTMLDRRVAEIYVSTDHRTQGNSYNSYVAALGTTYGTPNRLETKYYRNGVETGSSGEHLRWSNGDQYMEGSEAERAITIGSTALDAEITKQEARL